MVRPSPGGHPCQLLGALNPGLDSNGGTAASNKGTKALLRGQNQCGEAGGGAAFPGAHVD